MPLEKAPGSLPAAQAYDQMPAPPHKLAAAEDVAAAALRGHLNEHLESASGCCRDRSAVLLDRILHGHAAPPPRAVDLALQLAPSESEL